MKKYRVLEEYLDSWMCESADEVIVDDEEIMCLSEGWGTSVAELLDQVEEIDDDEGDDEESIIDKKCKEEERADHREYYKLRGRGYNEYSLYYVENEEDEKALVEMQDNGQNWESVPRDEALYDASMEWYREKEDMSLYAYKCGKIYSAERVLDDSIFSGTPFVDHIGWFHPYGEDF